MDNTSSGKTLVSKQNGNQDWPSTFQKIKYFLRLLQRVARAIELSLDEMFPDSTVSPGKQVEAKSSGVKNETRNDESSA